MSAEEILITNNGYTEMSYAVCGERSCTATVLRCLGVQESVANEYDGDDPIDLGDGVTVETVPLGESDHCEWCAACREFIRHGITYPGEDVGCSHDSDSDAPEHLDFPHLDFQDSPIMRKYLETAARSGKG